MADTIGWVNVSTPARGDREGYILEKAPSIVLYVLFASGLWSLDVEGFERGVNIGLKKYEFRPPSQSRLLSPLREDSDGEAWLIDLLTNTANPRIAPSSGLH